MANQDRVAELARMLEKMPEAERESLLARVAAKDPSLAGELRKGLFPFADIVRLELSELQALLARVPRPRLALALRGADPGLLASVTAALPARAAAELREEIEAMGKQRLSDVQAAQEEIARLAQESRKGT